ncbi:MAG: hypothetical protein OXI60_06680 [Acidiferrobacterales bacterium]|nr:hypothetical protein [Acidiferrobacterales bacterium]
MNDTAAPDHAQLAEMIDFAQSLADGARAIALRYHRKEPKNWVKSDHTDVTEVDLSIEEFIREKITAAYPSHGIYAEELGDSDYSFFKWCIDPIDGTEPFIFGLPTFGVLIALTCDLIPILGIIESPAMQQRWVGAAGFGTTFQGEPCNTNAEGVLAQAAVFSTSIDMFTESEREVFNRVTANARKRRFGADCYAYGLLASGHIDVVMESDMKPYDMMALVPVVTGAGGVVTDWDGHPINIKSGSRILASSNERIHEQCLELIRASANSS